MNKKILKKAFIDTIPVLTGYLALGIGFGILLKTAGYGFWYSLFMPITMYAGAMQYVAVDVLKTSMPFFTVALTTLLVNVRHLFYGISLIEEYRGAGLKKAYMIHALTDETYSLVSQDHSDIDKKDRIDYYFTVSLLDQTYWILGCVIGNLLGGIITFSTEGIDFVLTALFITLFTDQWLKTKDHTSAIVGVVSTILCRVIFGVDNFLIPTMILIIVLLFGMRSKLEAKNMKEGEADGN